MQLKVVLKSGRCFVELHYGNVLGTKFNPVPRAIVIANKIRDSVPKTIP